MIDSLIFERGNKIYATSRAYIVEDPSDARELAHEVSAERNPSFMYIAGRYVQGNKHNRNGQFWTTDDLHFGQASIKHTPLNLLHKFHQPVGVIVDTKMIEREEASESFPEIQALSVLWAANFPEIAAEVRKFHEQDQLWYSMECVAEKVQCMTCDNEFAFTASAEERCEHLSSDPVSPRRFINPTFLGGALIFPPTRPGWSDADITQVAKMVDEDYSEEPFTAAEWTRLMSLIS